MRTGFFFGEAVGSLRRNWVITLAAILTVFISMAILGLVLVINQNLNSGATSLKNRVEIEVFISDNASSAQVNALESRRCRSSASGWAPTRTRSSPTWWATRCRRRTAST